MSASEGHPLVDCEIRDGVAILTLHNPPVNLGNVRMRTELAALLDGLLRDEDLRGVVLTTALADFYAGSDIREFDKTIAEPQLPEVLERLDALEAPIVAAIAGNTLGGGLELALAADLRIAGDDLIVGFPEVELGMLPGAGGTVRAGRLIGPPATIRLVASAQRLGASEALRIGLVDEVVPRRELLERALSVVRQTGKRRLRDAEVPSSTDEEIARATAESIGRRTRPNVEQAIELIIRGAHLSGSEALCEERELFTRLRAGDEARALRHLFFARAAAAKSIRSLGAARPVRRIGIAGAGTMGASIAAAAAAVGFDVAVFDTQEASLARARARNADAATAIVFGDDIAVLSDSDVVIDAVFEDTEVKLRLLRELDRVLRDDAIIASNTSYLDLDALSTALRDPERFGGLHFFNPADRNPLVEVIRCASSADETLATLGALARRIGKVAIPARVADGFVANSIYAAYRAQAEILLEEGASPREVDQAIEGFGFAVGPFAVGDMSGLDIAWARRRRLAETRDPGIRYVAIPDRICEAGRLGKKTGAGYYDYPEGARRGVDSDAVAAIIAEERARQGRVPRSIPADEIVRRCIGSMVLTAAALVERGVAERAGDIDVALVEGFAFPRWRGGPVFWAANLPVEELQRSLTEVVASDPRGAELEFGSDATAAGKNLPPSIARLLG